MVALLAALGNRRSVNCVSISCAEIAESHLSRVDALWTDPPQNPNADRPRDSFLPDNLADGSDQKHFRRRCNAAKTQSENGYLPHPK